MNTRMAKRFAGVVDLAGWILGLTSVLLVV